MMFTPSQAGQRTGATYETVKDHFLHKIQESLRHGIDIATALRRMSYDPKDCGPEPTRKVVEMPKVQKGSTLDSATEFRLRTEQDGYDLKYRSELSQFMERKAYYEENKAKAYAMIFNGCNKAIQNRITESEDFKSKIRDNPIELLRAIRKKMYDPERAKYEWAVLTESLERILGTRQQDMESLEDYTKRFKQNKDIVKESVGQDVFDTFVEGTSRYQNATATKKGELKKNAFDTWAAYLYMTRSNQRKYGSLMQHLKTEFSLGRNAY